MQSVIGWDISVGPKEVRVRPLETEIEYVKCKNFRQAIDLVIGQTQGDITLDFSGVDCLDSSGLGLMLNLQKQVTPNERTLSIVTSETVDNILTLTKLNGIFNTVAAPE